MRPRALSILLAFTLLAASAFCQDKSRDWQTGKLVSIQAGKTTIDYTVAGPGSDGKTIPHESRQWIYVVETDTTIFQFSAYFSVWTDDNPSSLFPVGREVRFALDPGKPDRAYLLDDRGRSLKVSVKRIPKQLTP
ncbi:MAG TPA: hypothetical protein VE825_07075 [Terriglobales bacterium]|jgi:hypothetical protein|nr:hypothetical protein [Terriglobales bacterium]